MAEEFEIYRLLAQARPAGTAAVSGYAKPTKQLITITHIVICNTTALSANCSLFFDSDGTTYDQTTALVYAQPIGANGTTIFDITFTMEVDGGNIGIQTGTGSALTFNIFGKVKNIT